MIKLNIPGKNMKLDFAVIGSQKCATTWIYDCLKDHPQINVRDSKNEDAYYGGSMYERNGGDIWYFSQFKKDEPKKINGCVSVEYIEDEKAAYKLHSHNPSIKLIASLRNPADRAVSAYQWYVRKLHLPNLPLEQGMQEVIDHYYNKTSNQYSPFYKDVIERGFYDRRLKKILQIIPEKQLKISLFDEVKENPLNAFRSLLLFLDVQSDFIPPNVNTIPKKNMGIDPLIKLQRVFPTSKVVARIVDLSNQMLFKKTMLKDASVNLDKEIMAKLNYIYMPSVEQLYKLFEERNISASKAIKNSWLKN